VSPELEGCCVKPWKRLRAAKADASVSEMIASQTAGLLHGPLLFGYACVGGNGSMHRWLTVCVAARRSCRPLGQRTQRESAVIDEPDR
jgi:hypothetical protein